MRNLSYFVQATDHEFQFFMKDLNIKSITSSPYFHQSNGLGELMVKTSKNLIEKSLQLNKPWFYLLHKHCITPISENIPSPAEILFRRRMRSNLSIIPSQLMNPWISKQWEEIVKKENKLYTTGHIDTEMDLEVGCPYGTRTLTQRSGTLGPFTRNWRNHTHTPFKIQLDSTTDGTGTGLNQGKLTKQTF